MTRRVSRTLLVLVALGLAACRPTPAPTREAARVVSLSPNTTEAVFAVGAGDRLVGRSRFCDYPEPARRLPAVGGFADPSLEVIVGLRPTLVIGDRGPAGPGLEQALRAHGIDTYFPATDTIAGIQDMILGLGARLGRADAARRTVDRISADVARIRSQVADRSRVDAILVFDTSPIVLAGPGSFPDELLRLAGGRNLVSEGTAYPRVDIERLLALDPEVIIDASLVGAMPAAQDMTHVQSKLLDAPGWSELRAVRQRRVRVLRGSTSLRAGPRIADGLAEIARALHGG